MTTPGICCSSRITRCAAGDRSRLSSRPSSPCASATSLEEIGPQGLESLLFDEDRQRLVGLADEKDLYVGVVGIDVGSRRGATLSADISNDLVMGSNGLYLFRGARMADLHQDASLNRYLFLDERVLPDDNLLPQVSSLSEGANQLVRIGAQGLPVSPSLPPGQFALDPATGRRFITRHAGFLAPSIEVELRDASNNLLSMNSYPAISATRLASDPAGSRVFLVERSPLRIRVLDSDGNTTALSGTLPGTQAPAPLPEAVIGVRPDQLLIARETDLLGYDLQSGALDILADIATEFPGAEIVDIAVDRLRGLVYLHLSSPSGYRSIIVFDTDNGAMTTHSRW